MINERDMFDESWDNGIYFNPQISPLPPMIWHKIDYVTNLKQGKYIVITRKADNTFAIKDMVTENIVTKFMSEDQLKHFMSASLGVDISIKFKNYKQ